MDVELDGVGSGFLVALLTGVKFSNLVLCLCYDMRPLRAVCRAI